jgi:Putative Ig domain
MPGRLDERLAARTFKYVVPALVVIASTIVLNGCAGIAGAPNSGSTNPLTISTVSLADAVVGTPYSQTLQATGGTAPYSWSITSGSLPAGLTLAASSGVVSGTPTTTGTASFTAQVADASNNKAQKGWGISVGSALSVTTSSVPNGTVGSAYSATLQASGGTSPYSWSLSGGSLPAGLTLATSGVISGAPTATGTSSFTAIVTDSESHTAIRALSIVIAAGTQTLSISTSTLAGGTVGMAYSATLEATGGTTPYSWSKSSGSLPAGLTLNASTGAISGTPTTSGTSSFTVKVTDASDGTATKSLSVAVAAVPLTITTTSVPNASTNTAYSAFLYAGGGTTPYTWIVSSGSLPTGLTMTGTGDISGVPTASGTFPLSVKVTDSSSPPNTATANFSIAVAQGTAYSVSLAWAASSSSGVVGYNVYRSTASGGDYVRINSTLISPLSYVDGTVLDGTTYYYVATAVDSSGDESAYSPQCSVTIP